MLDLGREYLGRHARHNKTDRNYNEDSQMLSNIVFKSWEKLKVAEITSEDIQKLKKIWLRLLIWRLGFELF